MLLRNINKTRGNTSDHDLIKCSQAPRGLPCPFVAFLLSLHPYDALRDSERSSFQKTENETVLIHGTRSRVKNLKKCFGIEVTFTYYQTNAII